MGIGKPRRVRWRAAGAVVCGSLVLLLAAALPPAVSALTSGFAINGGAGYSRSLRVTLGDGGWSPFFEPGVVVWDGGSIMAGHGADPGLEFPTQTLALVPRACRSHVSVTPRALVADLIADAPREVDARYRAAADQDVCVVLAGGGDFRVGADPGRVFEGLKTYCAGRRASGFAVIVLTVLPRSDPPTFEPARLAFNQLVRDAWPDFADGIADIAADSRIGDSLDNLDQQYYRPDAEHPNNAGCAVMASVTAPVINDLAWRSSSCEMRVREEGGLWGPWRNYVVRSSWELAGGDGAKTVEVEYRDGHGASVLVSDSILVDTVRPTTVAPRDVRVRKGKIAALPYRILDPQPCGPTATVVITVTDRAGAEIRSFTRRLVAIGAPQSLSFVCRLPRGAYRCVVTARDTAGNPQSVTGSARLTVR